MALTPVLSPQILLRFSSTGKAVELFGGNSCKGSKEKFF